MIQLLNYPMPHSISSGTLFVVHDLTQSFEHNNLYSMVFDFCHRLLQPCTTNMPQAQEDFNSRPHGLQPSNLGLRTVCNECIRRLIRLQGCQLVCGCLHPWLKIRLFGTRSNNVRHGHSIEAFIKHHQGVQRKLQGKKMNMLRFERNSQEKDQECYNKAPSAHVMCNMLATGLW